MYLTVEVAPQLWEFESQRAREFSTKARRAWSGDPAAPTGLVVAEKDMVSSSRRETMHRHTDFVITHGAEATAASGGRYGYLAKILSAWRFLKKCYKGKRNVES